MATSKSQLTFHFDESSAPTKIIHILQTLQYAEEPVKTVEKLKTLAQEQDGNGSSLTDTTKVAQGDLGLIQSSKAGLDLTAEAQILLNKRENIQRDMLHFLFYSRCNDHIPESNSRSWFYRTVCDKLWYMQEGSFDTSILLSILQEVEEEIRVVFAHVPGLAEKLSIGMRTMRGVRAWLRDLSPSVLEKEGKKQEHFRRRTTCSAELFLLALSSSYQSSSTQTGMDVLLSTQKRDDICRICLLDPLQFDRMLDWILLTYPQFVNQGTKSGTYGRFIRLQHFVSVTDLCRVG